MSFEAMAWAVKQQIATMPKMVLIMLSNRHNADSNRCDPSLQRLAVDCGMTSRSVITHIRHLEEIGLITIENRFENGIKKSNSYSFNLSVFVEKSANLVVKEVHIDVKDVHKGSEGRSLGVVKDVHKGSEGRSHKTVIEPVNRNSNRGNGENAKKFTPPTLAEITAYIAEKNYPINPEKFFYYYEANGWMVGKNKMKNWKAAIGTWKASDFSKPEQKANSRPKAFPAH